MSKALPILERIINNFSVTDLGVTKEELKKAVEILRTEKDEKEKIKEEVEALKETCKRFDAGEVQ